MARLAYNTATPFGQLISGGIDKIQTSIADLDRSANAIKSMSAEQCQAEVGVDPAEFINFRNRLNDIVTHLTDSSFASKLVIFDQG